MATLYYEKDADSGLIGTRKVAAVTLRLQVHSDVQVAGRAAILARCALAREPEPLAVLNAGGYPGPQGAGRCVAAASGASRARVIDEQAAS